MARKRKLTIFCGSIKPGKIEGKSVKIGYNCIAYSKVGKLVPYDEVVFGESKGIQ